MIKKDDIDEGFAPPEIGPDGGDFMPWEDLEDAEEAIDERVARRVQDETS